MLRAVIGVRKWAEIAWWIRSKGAGLPRIRIRHSSEISIPYDVAIDRIPGGFELVYCEDTLRPGHDLFSTVIARLSAAIFWRMHASDDVERMVMNLSDGDYYTEGGFMYSTNWDHITPIPDWYFFKSHGFQELRDLIPSASVPWDQRSEKIVWRGSPTGNGYFTVFPHLMKHPKTIQRLQMAAHARDADLDFRLIMPEGNQKHASLKATGYLGEYIDRRKWFGMKYAVDIDGHSNTWDNLFNRLLMGCCVLKVDSAFGYRQWYYDRLKPFEHFVPVRADFADLQEKIDWIRDNDAEARQIAEAGQALALSMTFESETRQGAELIEKNWRRYV